MQRTAEPLTKIIHRARVCALLTVLALVTACASVPKESVELSYLIGQDMAKLQQSYDLMIQQRFEDYRAQRTEYLENVWIPAFIAEWIEEGRLVDTARGLVIYDPELDDFVAPTSGRKKTQLLATINDWSNAAVAEINDKRRSLLEPLDEQEKLIRNEAREAFDRLIRANAYITAHLNSIREVQNVQSQALEGLGVKDFVDTLNKRLVEISNSAKKGLNEIRKADNLVDRATEFRTRIRDNN